MHAYVLIAMSKSVEAEFLEELKRHFQVKEGNLLFGEWDLLIKLECNSSEEVATFVIEHIRSNKNVKLTSTLIVAR